jgi:glutaredoxin-related protein
MLKIYGSPLCPDCIRCKEELEQAGVEFLYLDITGKLLFLKQFLKLRERPQFDPIREKGQIGIPCILREDDTITFDWKEFL